MIWADLHCHSTCSDGTLTPGELVLKAKEVGLHGFSITDHDTTEAYPEAIEVAQKVGIRLGSGIEFSCHFEGRSLHLLGYDFYLNHEKLQELCKRHRLRRERRNRAILEKLQGVGIEISYEELSGKSIGRPHIAKLMVEKGFIKHPREAFHQYIGEGKPCYVPGEPFHPKEAIEVIHQAGGKAFLAHPHLLPSTLKIDRLLQFSFDGIEGYYAKLLPTRWLRIAETKSLLLSGGSDFHGSVRPEIELGCNGVDQMTFEKIFTK